MLPRFISARPLPYTERSDRRRPLLRIGAAAATAAAITGVTVAASAGTALAAPARTNGTAAAPGRSGLAAGAPVLQAPALRGTAPLAAQPFNDVTSRATTALSSAAPLANPATGGASLTSPLAATGPATAPPHRQPARPSARPAAQPSASPSASHPASSAPQQAASNSEQTPNSSQSASAQQRHYEFYDSVIPSAIPAGQIVATYATGPFAVSHTQVAGRSKVMWIDVNGSDPRADALDTEPGDATPSMAASWAYRKLKADPNSLACIYTALAEWPAVRAETSALPAWMQSHIRWWIANPTGIRHLVPGSDATQWYWGSTYDISTAKTRL